MKKLLFLFVLVLASAGAIAQEKVKEYNVIDVEEQETYTPMNNRLGAAASMLSGMGLSYQYHFGKGYAIKITGFAYADMEDENNYYNEKDDLVSSLGIEFQINMHKTNTTRLYGILGFSHWYNESTSSGSDYIYPDINNRIDYEYTSVLRDLVGGVGFGLEVIIWKHIAFNIDLGYIIRRGYNTYPETTVHYIYDQDEEKTLFIGPSFGIGAYYAF